MAVPAESGRGYESIAGLGLSEPPPPPIDPLNPGFGVPLRDDGVDLDELSGSSASDLEKKKNALTNTPTPKKAKSQRVVSKAEKNKKKLNAKKTKAKTTAKTPSKPHSKRPDGAPRRSKKKIATRKKVGRIVGPFLLILAIVVIGVDVGSPASGRQSAMEEPLVFYKPPEAGRTQWKAILVALVIACLTAAENTVLGVSEFAYLERMDPLSTAEFYGTASSIARAGHGCFALVFSLWVYKTQNIKAPLLFGRLLSLVTCCVYLSVEYFQKDRRLVMGGCYFFFDIATSAPTVLRVYMIAVSTRADRPRAYAALTLANWLAVVIGPVFQLLFAFISYPGIEILPGLRFHIFSAPVWLALFMNFLSIYLISRCLDNPPYLNEAPKFSLLALLEKVISIPRMDIQYSYVALCWLFRVVANISVVTLMTLTAPLLMVVFGYSGEETVLANSVASTGVGFLALSACSTLMFTRLTKKISPFVFFGISLLISLSMYMLTYPYPRTSHHLSPYNGKLPPIPENLLLSATTGAGCQPEKYPWCDSALAGNANLFLAMAAIQTGLGLPMAQISLDTIYSNVLGDSVDQNLMQGAYVAFEDFIYAIGPAYYAKAYTNYGQGLVWLFNFFALLFTVPVFHSFFEKYKKI